MQGMFPVNDFHIACCALATISVAVGYRVSRMCAETMKCARQGGQDEGHSLSDVDHVSTARPLTHSLARKCSTSSEKPSEITEPGSLKRKGRDEDPGDQSIENPERPIGDEHTDGPKKRSKIMSSTMDEARLSRSHLAQQPAPLSELRAPKYLHGAESVPAIAGSLVSDHEDPLSAPNQIGFCSRGWGTSRMSSDCNLNSPILSIPAVKASAAFACFANGDSAFAAAVTSPTAYSKPVWLHEGHSTSSDHAIGLAPESQNHRGAVSVGARVRSPAPPVAHSEGLENADRTKCVYSRDEEYARDDPLVAQTYTGATCTTGTGEEDEEVKAEVKGAKVFIKRGDSDFGDGILGHIKLLSHRKTADERLVFRREPVWKVSMSVRLRPAVRCTFDEKEGVLRVVLKEVQECDGLSSGQRDIVVYALKRGKATKKDFSDFARAVTRSTPLHTSEERNGSVL